MSTEQRKSPAPQEQPPFPPIPYPPQHFTSATFPPPGPYPPYYAFPPPPEGGQASDSSSPPGGPPGPPYMMHFPPPPPGMVYAYPHPPHSQGFQAYSPNVPAAQAAVRPKRRQVKMACTHCATACKRCDESRPCERCIKYGLTETCVDGQRKERKKGIKRGPYKRKNKTGDNGYGGPDGEWSQSNSPQPANSSATTAAAIHAVAQFPPEGYYHPYYFPPQAFVPPNHDGHPGPDGAAPNGNGQVPQPIPYYIHPGGYPPPFAHFPPGAYPPHGGPPPPPHVLASVEASKKPDETNGGATNSSASPQGKKRSRAGKSGESKTKKVKAGTASPPKVVPLTVDAEVERGGEGGGGTEGEGEQEGEEGEEGDMHESSQDDGGSPVHG